MPRVTATADKFGKVISPRFHNPGDTFTGLLLSNPPVKRQAKNMTGELKYWDEAKTEPVNEWIYEFLNVSTSTHPDSCHFCNLRDGGDDLTDDDGFRRLYASFKQHKVLQEAFSSAKNADGKYEIYGPMTLTYERDDKEKKSPGKAAPKIYVASYRIATDEEVARCDKYLGTDDSREPDDDYGIIMEKPGSKGRTSFEELAQLSREAIKGNA